MPDIIHKLAIHAKPGTVYANLTSIEGLAGWWTPDTSGKTEVGGVLRFGFGPEYFKEMKVVSLQPGKKVVWECLKATSEWVGTRLEFDFGPDGEKTTLVFSHSNWGSYTPMFAQCSYDWAMFLKSLKQLCEKGKGSPFPGQHQ